MKTLMTAMCALLMFFSPAFAQSESIRQDLNATLKQVTDLLASSDQIVARLRETAKRGPAEAQHDLADAATALGRLADRLQDQGDIMGELRAIERAAQAHRDRVAALPKGTISEAARSAVLPKWNAILQEAENARAKIATVRDKILGALTELRTRQIDLSEEILVGSYGEALKSLNHWLDDVQRLMEKLRRSIGAPGV